MKRLSDVTRGAQQYSNGWLTDARDHDGNPVDVGDVLVNINDGREFEISDYDSSAVYTERDGRDMQFASWYDVHLNWNKKVGGIELAASYELPTLQREIDKFNQEFDLDDEWNARYVVEEDDYDDSVLVHLYDYSETLDSDEFYGIGAYGELFPHWFERFEKAVQEDTGDAEFYFEPYSYSGHFIGRAHLKGQKRWNSTKKAMKNRKFSMKKKASDGWDNRICEDLIACLELCSQLEYEIKHCVRGGYCREAGDTYESLGTYAVELGRSLQMDGEALCDEYGDLTADEIDDMESDVDYWSW